MTTETAHDAIRDFLMAVDRGYLGPMPPGFNDSAFVKALRAQVGPISPPDPAGTAFANVTAVITKGPVVPDMPNRE